MPACIDTADTLFDPDGLRVEPALGCVLPDHVGVFAPATRNCHTACVGQEKEIIRLPTNAVERPLDQLQRKLGLSCILPVHARCSERRAIWDQSFMSGAANAGGEPKFTDAAVTSNVRYRESDETTNWNLTQSGRKTTLQRIFAEAYIDPIVNPAESAGNERLGTRVRQQQLQVSSPL